MASPREESEERSMERERERESGILGTCRPQVPPCSSAWTFPTQPWKTKQNHVQGSLQGPKGAGALSLPLLLSRTVDEDSFSGVPMEKYPKFEKNVNFSLFPMLRKNISNQYLLSPWALEKGRESFCLFFCFRFFFVFCWLCCGLARILQGFYSAILVNPKRMKKKKNRKTEPSWSEITILFRQFSGVWLTLPGSGRRRKTKKGPETRNHYY